MKNSYKTIPKNILDQIKKRRQTINITESQYNLPEKYKSPKTQKKQSYFIKDLKNNQLYHKPSSKIIYTENKKTQRANSLAPYQNDLTPKKLMFYHIDSSQPKQRPLRKIHSISLVDTPKKLNLKKKTEEHLFTVKQEKDKQGCKKVASSYKLSNKNYNKPLRIQSSKVHDSMQQQDTTPSTHMKSSKKMYSKNCQNYDIYYNQGGHNSSSRLRSSNKRVKIPQHGQNSSIAMMDKQKSSRTLRITRNSRSSNHINGNDSNIKKNSSNNNTNSKNNTKSQKGIKSPRVQQFDVGFSQQGNEKKYEKMFFKCSLILKKYNNQLQKLKGENESLKRQNEYLKSSISLRQL